MLTSTAMNTTSNLTRLVSEFKSAAEEIAKIITDHKVSVSAYHDSNLVLFLALDDERRRNSLTQITIYKESLQMAAENGSMNEKQSLWTTLKHLGMRPKSDIFEVINSNEAVEAYDLSGIQFWRNLKFLEVCNYTIEEMFCLPWHERYDRDLDAAKMTEDIVIKIVTGQITETYNCDIYNVLIERHSAKKYAIDVHHKQVSPLYSADNTVAGFIVISSVKVIAMMGAALSATISPDVGLS